MKHSFCKRFMSLLLVAALMCSFGVTALADPADPAEPEFKPSVSIDGAPSGAVEAGTRIRVGGIVTHRQRPATAGGVTFVNLEDETGMLNVTCSPGLWQRYRRVARTSSALLVRGRLENAEGVLNLVADRLEAITPPIAPASRDFR